MKGDDQADMMAVAELLARRWQENRPYFLLQGSDREVGLHCCWLRRRPDGGSGVSLVPNVKRRHARSDNGHSKVS
jgi:hypothetical protein